MQPYQSTHRINIACGYDAAALADSIFKCRENYLELIGIYKMENAEINHSIVHFTVPVLRSAAS